MLARRLPVASAVSALAVLLALPAGAHAAAQAPAGATPVAVGSGGAVASMDAGASQAGIDVLKQGGNAVDAAELQAYPASRALLLTPSGNPLPVGSLLRNPDLARTYRLLARYGPSYLYDGPLGQAIVQADDHPVLAPGQSVVALPGIMTTSDLRAYQTRVLPPTRVRYRGLDVYSMAPPSSGGSTVGEALNILSGYNLSAGGKQPRSSMGPVIAFRGGQPVFSVGAAGGSTIPTTILQIILNHVDFGMPLPAALAAPRVSQRNAATSLAEPGFYNSALAQQLTSQFGEKFTLATGPILPLDNYPGDATALQVLGHGQLEAIAEPVRRGGGSALVVHPAR